MLPAAVMRSAPFLPGAVVFVAESVGFRSLALSVCEGLEDDTVLYKTVSNVGSRHDTWASRDGKKTYTTGADVEAAAVVLDWVMEN